MENRYKLESVERVMQTLNAFSTETPELRLTDLSELLELPKPQVLRIASTLVGGGYLARDPDTKRYRLGLRLYRLGMMVSEQLDLRRIARPVIERLAEQTLETVALTAADPSGPICIDVIESPKGLRVFANIGRQMPWNAGVSGKLVLAFLPEEQREQILMGSRLKKYNRHTITDPDDLRILLAKIRSDGFHVAVRDLDEDAIGFGAPLFDHDARVVGAISVAAPLSRVSEPERMSFVASVRAGASEISRQLGCPLNVAPLRAIAD